MWLFANEVNCLRVSQGTLEDHPGSFSTEEPSPGLQDHLRWLRKLLLFFNLQHWPTSSDLLCAMCTGDRAVFCRQALSGLCYLKQISFALQRQSAEQSIMCTLCLTRPIGEILPEEKIRLWKKCIILLSHETEMTREWSLESHNFGKHFKDALAKELSQYFPLHSMSSWVLREKSEFNCIWQF